MTETNPWEIVYKGNLVAVERHSVKGFERAVRPPGVRLILKNPEGKYLMTREYRHEQDRHDVRLPGGKVFDDLDSYLGVRANSEDLLAAAISAASLEAKQETGTEIANVNLVNKSVCGATVEWDLFYFTADIKSHGDQELDGDEVLHGIEIGYYSAEEIMSMIKSGDISEDRSVAVLIRLFSDNS